MNDAPAGRGQTASAIRCREMQVATAFAIMSRMSDLQRAEVIAQHYLKHVAVAQNLLRIADLLRRGATPNEATATAVKYLVDRIRNDHAFDLGIELNWPSMEERR